MDDFEELDKMLKNIVKEFPEKKKELLKNAGEVIQNQIRENIEDRVNTSSDKHEKEKLIEGVEKVFGTGGGYVAVKPDYSKGSFLHHLLENGHRIVRNGVVVGFANGKHFYRDSAIQCEDKIIKMAEDMVNEVIKDD